LKLIADVGNTLMKLAVFDGKLMVAHEVFPNSAMEQFRGFTEAQGPFDGIILSSVIREPEEMTAWLSRSGPLLILDAQTPVPIRNSYQTPETLGKDRLAAAVGAWSLFPGRNILSIDAGTCITFDFVSRSGEYLGGAISPGIRMRFQAMHTFTGKLPLIEPEDFTGPVGRSTRESLLSGVIHGVTEEIRGVIALYRQEFGDLEIILTGGDHEFLHNKLKINIFAAPYLVLLGLNEILDHHDQTR
jgi:type III pantothenate kinase